MSNKLFEQRRDQLMKHMRDCPYKRFLHLVPGIPEINSPALSLVTSNGTIDPSDSASQIKRRKAQSVLVPSFYKDSLVDRDPFERNIVNVIASTVFHLHFSKIAS